MGDHLKLDSINSATLLLKSTGADRLLLGVATAMARSISNPRVNVILTADLQNSLDGDTINASVGQGLNYSPDTALTSGTTANKADWIWTDSDRTLTSGNTEDIDVYDLASIDIGAGAGLDALGQSVALVEVVGLFIHVDPNSAGALLIGGKGTTAAWNSLLNASDSAQIGPIGADGVLFVYNPVDPAFAVADTSNHLLQIEASGGDVTYSITILGRLS